MKNVLLFSFFIFFFGTIKAQLPKIVLLDSNAVSKMQPGTFTYFNASAQTDLTIEKKTDIFVDFASADLPTKLDSVVLKVGNLTTAYTNFKPFLIKNCHSTLNFSITAFHNGKPLIFKTKNSKTLAFEFKYSIPPLIIRDEMVFGLLTLILALIFFTSHKQTRFWKKFYTIIPALLLCYVIPAILVYFNIISAEHTKLYNMARDYLLPAALILMTLGIDFKALMNLGPKALIMFITGTIGVILGGPIAIIVYSFIDPSVVGGVGYEAAWRGMSTIAGSWIGGGANQNAMYETYKYAPNLYGKMIVVDIIVANIWMAILLYGASRAEKIDRWLKADTSAIEELKANVMDFEKRTSKQPTTTDYIMILGIAFSIVGLGHFGGNILSVWSADTFGKESFLNSSFLWLVIIATTGGLLLSMTKLRKYEGVGASKIGGVFIYILVVTIGMKMELGEAFKEPQLILVGVIWMIVHAGLMILVAKLIKAPFFFLAVGSQANIGGAASAPVVAAAFHQSLASVGAILAVFGYALGTYGAIVCAEIMKMVAP